VSIAAFGVVLAGDPTMAPHASLRGLAGFYVGILAMALAGRISDSELDRSTKELSWMVVSALHLWFILGLLPSMFRAPEAFRAAASIVVSILAAAAFALSVSLVLRLRPSADPANEVDEPRQHSLWLASIAAAMAIAIQIALGSGVRQHLIGLGPHALGALAAMALLFWPSLRILAPHSKHEPLKRTVMLAFACAYLQAFLGIGIYASRILSGGIADPAQPGLIEQAHRAGGAVLLAATAALAVQILRYLRQPAPALNQEGTSAA
jgi:hypothetical protein